MRASFYIPVLTVLVLATANKNAANSEKPENPDQAGSFDFGTDLDSHGASLLSSLASQFDSIFNSASDTADLLRDFGQMVEQFESLGSFGETEELDDASFRSAMGNSFDNMARKFAENMPDPMTDPEGFAKFAASMESSVSNLGGFGESLLNDLFDQEMSQSMSELGISNFNDGEMEASDFFEQMDADSWKVIADIKSHTDIFNLQDVSSDDFFGMVEMAGELGENFASFLALINDTSLATPELLGQLPPELFAVIQPSILQMIASNFSLEQTKALCMGLMYTDPDTAGEIFNNVDCTEVLANIEGFEFDPEYEEAIMEAMRDSKPRDEWSEADWERMAAFPAGFEPDDFDSMPDDVLLKNLDNFAEHVDDMDEGDLYAMFDEMESAFGDFSHINSTMFAKMGPMLEYMSMEDLEMIPPDQKYAALDSFAGIELDDEMAAEFAEDILGVMPAFDQWSPLEFGRALDFIKYDEDAIGEIPIDSIIGSLDKMGKFDFDDVEAATITDRIMADATWGDAVNWNATMIADAGSLLSGFNPDFLLNIPEDAIYDALTSGSSKFNRIDLERSSARVLLDKVISKVGGIGNLNTTILGQAIKALTTSEISQIQPDMLIDALDQLDAAYDDIDQASRRAVINKVKTKSDGLDEIFTKLGRFFADLTLDEVDSLPYHLIDPKTVRNLKMNIRPSESQARRAWFNVVSRIGTPDKAAANWTINMYKTLDRAICGAPCSVLTKIPVGKKFASVIDSYAKLQRTGSCLSDSQMRCFATRIRSYLFKSNSTSPNYKYLTKANVKMIAQFLPFFSAADLNAFNVSLCSTVLNAIGKYQLPNVGRPDLIKLKNYALTCSGKLETQEKITVGELRAAGDISCGMEVVDVPRLDTKVFLTSFKKMFQRCQYPLDVGDALFERALTIFNITEDSYNITEKALLRLGPAVRSLNDTMLAKVPQAVMVKAVGRIKKAIDIFEKKMDVIKEFGMDSDMTNSDRSKLEDRAKTFYGKVARDIIAKREAAAVNSRRRRKRATTYSSLTCSDLKKMGSGVTSLSITQLNLANSAFSSCYEFLGQQTAWSDAQKEQLITVTKRVWGSTSTWTSAKIVQLGTISQGLTTTELNSFTYNSDILSAWGQYSGWTSAQLSAVYSTWLTSTQAGSTSNVDGTELQSLGVFACGATSSQIATLVAAAYKVAAQRVGVLTVCDEAKLQAYATLAKMNAAFGAVSTWDASTVATIGTVIGGLSAEEIASLSSTQIEAVSTSTIRNIPASAFAGFSSSQLSSMSTSQIRSISTTQAAALSESAQSTLTSSSNYIGNTAAGSDSVGSKNRSAAVSFNFVLYTLVSLYTAMHNL